MSDKLKLAIVDDHQFIIDGLKANLSKNLYEVVAEGKNGNEAIEIINNTPVDVLIIDMNMPQLNGLETVKHLSKKYPSLKIIVLTLVDEIPVIRNMIKSGAMGYLLKSATPDEIDNAIEHVVKEKSYYSKEVTDSMLEDLIPTKETTNNIKLTDFESKILALVEEEYSVEEMSKKLNLNSKTITRIKRSLEGKLKKKLP